LGRISCGKAVFALDIDADAVAERRDGALCRTMRRDREQLVGDGDGFDLEVLAPGMALPDFEKIFCAPSGSNHSSGAGRRPSAKTRRCW